MGQPGLGYPWHWSIYRWLEGDTVASLPRVALPVLASDLAGFLLSLQGIEANAGPAASAHSFQRGSPLAMQDAQVRDAIALHGESIDAHAAMAVWSAGLASGWRGPPVWVHGDIAPGNLLMRRDRLCAVIDFGQLAVGDPACDLAIAWTLFSGVSKERFRDRLQIDAGTWNRGRAWALWKALIVHAGLCRSNLVEMAQATNVLREVFCDVPLMSRGCVVPGCKSRLA